MSNDGSVTITLEGDALEAAKSVARLALVTARNVEEAHLLCIAAAQLIEGTSQPDGGER